MLSTPSCSAWKWVNKMRTVRRRSQTTQLHVYNLHLIDFCFGILLQHWLLCARAYF